MSAINSYPSLPDLVDEGNMDKVIRRIKDNYRRNTTIWSTHMFLIAEIERLRKNGNR